MHVNPLKRQTARALLRVKNKKSWPVFFLSDGSPNPSIPPLPLLSSPSHLTLPPSFPHPSPSLLSPYFPSFLNVVLIFAVIRIVTADAGYVKSNHCVLLTSIKNFDRHYLCVLVSLPL